MKYLASSVCLFAVAITAVAQAQQPAPFFTPMNQPSPNDTLVERPEPTPSIPGVSQSEMTPELYLYLHEQKRMEDPKLAVRRKAEIKTEQRMNRLAAQKWYGISNSRPMASAQPFMDMYSPRWIGNGYNAFNYSAGSQGSTVLRIETQEIRR